MICEVCNATNLVDALNLGEQALCDDLIPIGSDMKNVTYPIEIKGCPQCFTFHQAHSVKREVLFPRSYHYRAALTNDVLRGMKELVTDIEAHIGTLNGKRVLDIGCNDGSLLSFFKKAGAITYGIEPTDAALDAQKKSLDWIHQGYFDKQALEIYLSHFEKPDIITFTNVFAHIENLPNLLKNVKALLSHDTKLVVENHYMGSVADLKQVDTFYHEHPRTYSAKSFSYIAETLGCHVESIAFPKRYNGNIRVIIGKGIVQDINMPNERAAFEALCTMQNHINERSAEVHDSLKKLSQLHGPLPAKAFPGRAAINIYLFKLDETIIDCTYEQPRSPKIGHYVPGTKIEIRNENEFFEKRISSPVLVNLAWHIHEEICSYMTSGGYVGEIKKAWIE